MRTPLLEGSPEVIEARANVFSALGDPTRMRIFHAIVAADESPSVTEICERTDLAANLVSHHLNCLRNCKLVTVEADGRKRHYSVASTEAVSMLALADEITEEDRESVLTCEIVGEAESENRD